MRTIVLTVMIAVASPTLVVAQSMPTMPPSTYPETGTFCGLLTLCPEAEKTKVAQ